MNTSQAIETLNPIEPITAETIKAAYKKAAFKFHPDRNPAGLEMMKIINEAWSVVKEITTFDNNTEATATESGYSEAVNDAINAVIILDGVEIEICGNWVWLSGNTYPHKTAIKDAGFKWASKKKMWFYRPDSYKSKNRRNNSMNDIRARHGSQSVKSRAAKKIA